MRNIRSAVITANFMLEHEDLTYTNAECHLEDIKVLKKIEELHSSINEIQTVSFYADEYKDIRSLIPEHFWKDSFFKKNFKYLIDL